MKVTVSKTELLTALHSFCALKYKPRFRLKDSISINLSIDESESQLMIAAITGENSLLWSLSVKVIEKGQCAISIETLANIIKTLKDCTASEVIITSTDTHFVYLQCGCLEVKIIGENPDEYSLPVFPAIKTFTVSGDTLKGLINRVIYAINETGRFSHDAALFVAKNDCVGMVTTDGYRLANVKRAGTYDISSEFRELITQKTLNLLKNLVNGNSTVEIAKDDTTIYFRCAN